jgi:hypothetical protein
MRPMIALVKFSSDLDATVHLNVTVALERFATSQKNAMVRLFRKAVPGSQC